MAKKLTKNIGALTDKILAFGGVYSNLQALEKMQAIADKLAIPPSNIICTGDVVGYCAQPEESIQVLMDWGIHCIAGNVELQLREGAEDCGCDFNKGSRCDVFSRQWYPFSKAQVSASSVEWMNGLPDFIQFQYGTNKAMVVHGSYHETAEYLFKSTPWEVKARNFQDTQSTIILAGHCGLPFNDSHKGKFWLNPGVIGMPANDGTMRVWYMLLYLSADQHVIFEHCTFEYDYLKAASLMEEQHLPHAYAQTLKTGLWDNCEILPDEETAMQGHPINFSF